MFPKILRSPVVDSDFCFDMLKTLAICCLTAVSLFALSNAGQADTIAHYRFENDLVTDSSGNGNTLSVINTPMQIPLPASGPGSDFSNPVPQTGAANASCASFGYGTHSLTRIFSTPVVSGSFTVEAYVHADHLIDNFGKNIVTNFNAPNGVTKGFMLTVRTRGDWGTSPRELALFVWDTSGVPHTIGSGFIMSPGKDYYVAASFDDSTNTIDYYRQNLTDGTPLEISNVVMGGTWDLSGTEALHIGSGFDTATQTFSWNGLIDEVRLSDTALPQNQLLISNSNSPPVADAGGDQSIRAGDPVILDGTASYDDNTASALLTYQWSFDSVPAGSSAALDDPGSATPTFIADLAGTYSLQLIVTDEAGATSDPDNVIISSNNLAPTAVATSEFTLAIVGEPFLLDGTGSSDPEGDAISYQWSLVPPQGSTATLDDPGSPTPSFTPDVEGAYQVMLEGHPCQFLRAMLAPITLFIWISTDTRATVTIGITFLGSKSTLRLRSILTETIPPILRGNAWQFETFGR